MRVLLADHDRRFMGLLADVLRQSGFELEMAGTGRAALEKFQAFPPAAVLMESDLRDMPGLEVLTRMHRMNEQVPVIIVTNDNKISSAVKMVKAGAYDYLLKSQANELPSVVKNAVQIGQSPELMHERMQVEGEQAGSHVHREHPRVPFTQEVVVDGRYRGKAINISAGGLYVHTGRSHTVGNPVQCAFSLLDYNVNVKGIVRQSEFGLGMGMEFVDLKPEVSKLLHQLVQQTAEEKTDQNDSRKWLLLIVDDVSALKMYKSKLILEGYAIAETQTYQKCVELSQKKHVHAIMLDLDIKKADVAKIIRTIKSSPQLKSIPLMAFSGMYRKDLADKLAQMGVASYVSRATTTPKRLVQILDEM